MAKGKKSNIDPDQLKSKIIWIADDGADSLALNKFRVKKLGVPEENIRIFTDPYELTKALGTESKKRVNKKLPDIIITDWNFSPSKNPDAQVSARRKLVLDTPSELEDAQKLEMPGAGADIIEKAEKYSWNTKVYVVTGEREIRLPVCNRLKVEVMHKPADGLVDEIQKDLATGIIR